MLTWPVQAHAISWIFMRDQMSDTCKPIGEQHTSWRPNSRRNFIFVFISFRFISSIYKLINAIMFLISTSCYMKRFASFLCTSETCLMGFVYRSLCKTWLSQADSHYSAFFIVCAFKKHDRVIVDCSSSKIAQIYWNIAAIYERIDFCIEMISCKALC